MKYILNDKKIDEKYKYSYYMNVNRNIKAVYYPIGSKEVSDIVKYCYENDLTFIPVSGFTGAVGGQYPINDNTVIIDLKLMNKIINFDEETMTLNVEAGVKLKQVHDFLDNTNYFYPPDPGSKESTISGNTATNAGGMRTVKYGTTRNYIKQLEIVLPTGQIMIVGSLNVKDASGYNLKDLIIGSEGTLAIITKISLKVIKKTKYKKSIIMTFDSSSKASNTVLRILNYGIVPTALEIFDKETINYSEKYLNLKFPSQKGTTYILTTLDSEDMLKLEKDINTIKEQFKEKSLEFIELNDKEEKTAWLLRDSILYALMNETTYEMLDVVVPLNNFSKIINYTKELEKIYNTKILNFGHAGDGNIHTILLKENKSDEEWV